MKNIAPFTDKEVKILKGSMSLLATKHKVSRKYVYMIATGRRPAISKKSRAIFSDLERLIKALQPIV